MDKILIFSLLILCMPLSTMQAQNANKWTVQFNTQREFSRATAPLIGREQSHSLRSDFSGWNIAVQRNLRFTKNLEVAIGLGYTNRTHHMSRNPLSLPFTSRGIVGLSHHYLSIPATFQFNRKRIVKPYLTVDVGRRFAQTGSSHLQSLARQVGGFSFSIRPGVEIALSKKVSLLLSLNYTNYDLDRSSNFLGAQVGLRISF